jgi:hypothetical protein
MRRTLIATSAVAALAAGAALFTSPAGGQQPEGEGGEFSFEVIKDVHGDGPTGGFVVAWECVDPQGGVIDSGTLNFDTAGPGVDETQVVESSSQDYATCTIDEVDSNGADLVEYECEVFGPPGAPEGDGPSCASDQSATHLHPGTFASFLVRNTFDPEVLPEEEEPPAVNPDVVAASPSFTG